LPSIFFRSHRPVVIVVNVRSDTVSDVPARDVIDVVCCVVVDVLLELTIVESEVDVAAVVDPVVFSMVRVSLEDDLACEVVVIEEVIEVSFDVVPNAAVTVTGPI